jgi:hypothetical protein
MSRKPYECFKCRDNGYANTMVYLAGKDESGKTVYVEEDGTPHLHKTKHNHSISDYQGSVTEPITTAMKIINAKLDRIIALLQESQK